MKAEESLASHFNILNRGGMDANENFSSQFSSAVSSSLDVFDVVDASLLTSIDRESTNSFEFTDLDHMLFFAFLKIYPFFWQIHWNSIMVHMLRSTPWSSHAVKTLIDPKSDHSHKIIEITNNAWKYLLDGNLVSFKITICIKLTQKNATYQILQLVFKFWWR